MKDYTAVSENFGDDIDIDARPEQATSSAVKSGWAAADEQSASSSKEFATEFKYTEEPQVIKFLDEGGPFATYRQHFLQQKTSGKRSYVCLGKNCPLCVMLDHKPEDKYAFTIINLSAGMQKQILIATPRFFKTLKAAEFSPQGPLPKNFWAVSRSGSKQTTVYNFQAIKARDLDEDWSISLEEAEAVISKTTPYLRSEIRENSYAELYEIATELQ